MPRKNNRFSRRQLKDLKSQVKSAREKAILEETVDEQNSVEQLEKLNTKKDKLGFSYEDRQKISEKISKLEKSGPKLTWNFDVGSLVYIPNGEVGIIVRNEAQDVEVKHYDYDMKKVVKNAGRYAGQVYVVTSAGNNWYYPRQLKIVREN